MVALPILEAALNKAFNEVPRITVLPALCKRVRLRKSDCRKCVQICPENAISLDPGPILNKGCSGCALCERVCPTEALQSQVCKESSLLNMAKSFPGKKRLVIHCHRAEGESKDSLSILCLGGVSENLILGGVLLGFDEFILIPGVCTECRFQKGMELLTDSIMTSRVLLEGLGSGKFPFTLIEQPKAMGKILSRREIFSKLSNEVRKKTSSYLDREEGTFQKLIGDVPERKDKRSSLRRRFLQMLVKQKGWNKSVVLKYKTEFPWGKIKIDEKNCSACGICLALCPRGAIFSKLEDGCQLFYHNSSLCINCSLCREACPQNSIDFEMNLPLPDIFENAAKIVARIELNSCIVCGEMITAEKGNRCFTCQKRQVQPAHVSG